MKIKAFDFGLTRAVKFKGIMNALYEVGAEEGSPVKVKGSEPRNKK